MPAKIAFTGGISIPVELTGDLVKLKAISHKKQRKVKACPMFPLSPFSCSF